MSEYWKPLDFEASIRDYEFTRRAARKLNAAVYSAEFEQTDSEVILRYLLEETEFISFKDYLRRYIYERAGIEEPFWQVPEEEYQAIIMHSFEENEAPHSFTNSTKRWSITVKDWLKLDSVKRDTVFLLGFGLRMTGQDVSEFLTKVLKEEDIRRNDAREQIFLYCFEHALPYAKALELLNWYEKERTDSRSRESEGPSGPVNTTQEEPVSVPARALDGITRMASGNMESKYKNSFWKEWQLKAYLKQLKQGEQEENYASRALREYRGMLDQAKEIIAGLYQKDEKEKGQEKKWRAADITYADLERVICNGIPVLSNGNLKKTSASVLGKKFQQKCFSRQRAERIVKGQMAVDRFDLITLRFFIDSQVCEEMEPEKRCEVYLDEINECLKESGMAAFYVVNPYEAFILMCLLCESPLGTYSEIWEKSYYPEEGEGIKPF